MISGINIRCKVGNIEVLRSPYIIIESKRRHIMGRATIEVPDADGMARASLSIGDKVKIVLSYRGESNLTNAPSINSLDQTWQGTIESIITKQDSLVVQAVGLEKALLDTVITESFYNEPADIVAKRLLSQTGFGLGNVDIGTYILPHQVFSSVPVSRAIKQLEASITRAFAVDMTKHALWLSADKLWHWSAEDEPGQIYRVATAENLLTHKPARQKGEMGELVTVLLPGLRHSRKINIRDKTKDVVLNVRAQEVIHECKPSGNRTIILYGKDEGWG